MTMTDELALTADEQAAYKTGYEAAVNDANNWLRDVWVPISMRWRHVVTGDVFLGAGQRQWMVSAVATGPSGAIDVKARQGADEFPPPGEDPVLVDPDDMIPVLVLTTEREALELTRAELGAVVIERRAA